jgi:hypothetical protein
MKHLSKDRWDVQKSQAEEALLTFAVAFLAQHLHPLCSTLPPIPAATESVIHDKSWQTTLIPPHMWTPFQHSICTLFALLFLPFLQQLKVSLTTNHGKPP